MYVKGQAMTTKKAEQAEHTRSQLLRIARAQFAAHGYAETPMEALVGEAGLTRGALYHHFGGKEGLFRAVVELVLAEIAERVQVAAERETDPWEQLIAGCHAFVAASLDADVQRIVLIDAPAVLGWQTWRTIDAALSMRALRQHLADLMAHEMLPALPLDVLTHTLSGAMNEVSLYIASAADPPAVYHDAEAVLRRLLEGLRR
jgi:AcrR family transcriptional regulator